MTLSSLGFWPILRREWSIPWKTSSSFAYTPNKDSRTGRILRVSFNHRANTGIGEWRHDVNRKERGGRGVVPRRFLDSRVPRRRYLISTIWFTRGIESSNDEWTVYYANSYVGTDDRDSLLINRGHNAVGERRIVPVLWILMQFLNKDIFGNIRLCRYYIIWYYIRKIFCFCNFLKTNGCFWRNNFVRWN